MEGAEIREKIKSNNEQIKSLLLSGFFVLNKEIAKLIDENDKLKSECPHNFINGVCEFCGKGEE